MIFPNMQITARPSESRVIEFKGYDVRNTIDPGSMREMKNLSSDEYPCLAPRKKRGVYDDQYEVPSTLLARHEKLAVCDATSFWYGGERKFDFEFKETTDTSVVEGKTYYTRSGSSPNYEYTAVESPAGNPMALGYYEIDAVERQMQAINKMIVIYPDKIYYDIETGEHGNLGNAVHPTSVTFHKDPVTYETRATFVLPSGENLKGFNKGDAISFKGMSKSIIGYKSKHDNNITNAIIEKIDYTNKRMWFAYEVISFPNSDERDFTDTGESTQGFTIEREVPDLDFILEYNNRMYGTKNNTIYASKLGDPKNWYFYGTGTAESAYAAEVGTDGEFTGIAAHPTHIVFFKENCIHKLYGHKPANFQLITTACIGLEKGSHKSIQLVNGSILYKSREGIMVYTGDLPVLISRNFGNIKYDSAVAGTDQLKYYVSMRNKEEDKWYMFVFDMDKEMWHVEDNTHASCFAYVDNELVYSDKDRGVVVQVIGKGERIDPDPVEWYAKFGNYDEFVENKKVYSKLNMRLQMEPESEFSVWISINDGAWECVQHLYSEFRRVVEMPIVPRRCDKFAVMITGKGKIKLESLTRLVREGTMK